MAHLNLTELHAPHRGRQSGRTTYMLTCAIGCLDFHDVVVVACRNEHHKMYLKCQSVGLLRLIGFEVQSSYTHGIDLTAGQRLVFLTPSCVGGYNFDRYLDGLPSPVFEDHPQGAESDLTASHEARQHIGSGDGYGT